MKTSISLILTAGAFAALASLGCRPRPANTGYQTRGAVAYAAPTPTPMAPVARHVTINGMTLTPARANTLARLEASQGQVLPDGAYWYDAKSGAAGRWGGPTENFLPAGLDLGPPVPTNASGGSTGVVINNREIHIEEYRWLANLLGQRPAPGRYWLDANGYVGFEGGPVLGNLVSLARQRGGEVKSSSWGHHDGGIGGRGSIGVAGDGQTTCVNTAAYTRCY